MILNIGDKYLSKSGLIKSVERLSDKSVFWLNSQGVRTRELKLTVLQKLKFGTIKKI